MTRAEFLDLAARVSAATENIRQPANPLAGIASVRNGVSVGTAWPPPLPFRHVPARDAQAAPPRLHQWFDHGDGWRATNDRLELDVHGATAMTHLDAPEHFTWTELSAEALHRRSSATLAHGASTGITGRGVLLDVSKPAEHGPVSMTTVRDCLEQSGVAIHPGDTLYLHFGRSAPLSAEFTLGSAPMRGLSIHCAEWIGAQGLAAIVTDEGLDPSPSEVEGEPVPWHLFVLGTLGIPLVDWARLDHLTTLCHEREQWEFLSCIAPLPLPGASGSPVNPIVVL